MALRKAKGNMYQFINTTWNPIKGKCPHKCSYCYVRRILKRYRVKEKPAHLDERVLKTALGNGNYIFVGSSCDMFAEKVKKYNIEKVLERCNEYDNTYFFQTKNPGGFWYYGTGGLFPKKSIYCVTLETNRYYKDIMGTASLPVSRADEFSSMGVERSHKMITVEPIMKFDLKMLVKMIKSCDPFQVNIGADSGKNGLPEPSGEEIKDLIEALGTFTKVYLKENLKRIYAAKDNEAGT